MTAAGREGVAAGEDVKLRLSDLVMEFCRQRMAKGTPEFRAMELVMYVGARTMVAPTSPQRALQALKNDGEIHYEVVNHGQSLLKIIWIVPRTLEQAVLNQRWGKA